MNTSDATPQGRPEPGAGGYEKRDARAGWIFAVIAGLLVGGVVLELILNPVMHGLNRKPAPADPWTGITKSGAITSGFPRLQLSPREDLKAFRAREDAQLNHYGWVNRSSGVVRIPIERAIDWVAQQGLPTRKGTNQDILGPSSYDLQQMRTQYLDRGVRSSR